MNQEITDYIENCDTCNMYTSHAQREPLIVHDDVPERPRQKVSCDIFTLDEKDYVLEIIFLVILKLTILRGRLQEPLSPG